MAGIKSVYFSDEALISLENKKNQDPDFNLSAFISECLLRENESFEDPEVIGLEIEKMKSEINVIKNNIDILEEKKRKIALIRENELKEDSERKLKEKRDYNDQLMRVSDNFEYFFEINKKMARDLAIEFLDNPKEQRGSVFDFGEKKQLKPRMSNDKE